MAIRLCDKCDKPLSPAFWLHLFHDDGKEDRVFKGRVPDGFSGVVVRICARCPRGWKGKVSEEEQVRMKADSAYVPAPLRVGGHRGQRSLVADDGKRVYTDEDVTIRREGDRILMFLPWRK